MDLNIIRWEGRISGIAFSSGGRARARAGQVWPGSSGRRALGLGESSGKPPHFQWTLPASNYFAEVDWASFSRKYS
jgi:hypothetical protein